MLTRNVVSTLRHTVDPPTLSALLPPHPFPSGNHYFALGIYVCFVVWFGYYYFFGRSLFLITAV